MAIDSRDKRRSMAHTRSPWGRMMAPIPEGSITQEDRQMIPGRYSGIAFVETLNDPIFWKIIDKMKTLIGVYMDQANGFSLDYGSVDEYDPAVRTYPAVFFEYPETGSEEEIQVIERDSETTDVIIKIMVANSADLDKTAFQVINDFGLLMESFKDTLKIEGLQDYETISTEYDYTTIAAYPLEVKLTYTFKYRRKNSALYTPDTSATAETYSGSAFSDPNPVIMDIIDQIETNIGLMLKVNGYNMDYGSLNDYDPNTRTYPAVFLRYTENQGIEDEDSVPQFYDAVTRLQIVVIGGHTTQIDKRIFLARTDFQKMFKDGFGVLNSLGLGRAEYVGTDQNYTLIKAYPSEITLHYNLYHRKLRNNPYHS